MQKIYRINFQGFIITVEAETYKKARYAAYKKFKEQYNISFAEFMYSAREGWV